MGSTIYVKCGGDLIPHSYCNVCHDVLCFTCSSCSMYTDERIHANYLNASNQNNNGVYLQDTQRILEKPRSYQLLIDDNYYNTENHLNEDIKYNSIKLLTLYWNSIFDSIKLVNRYWSRIFSIGKVT